MKKIILISAFLTTIVIIGANAQTTVADSRETAQRVRIHEGRTSGEVTHREAAHLNKQQRRIHRTERRVKADGEVTRHERRRLAKEQNRANRHIRRAKHNEISK
jgi:hypothetical protein